VVAQSDERHANRTVAVLEWYMTDTEHSTISRSSEGMKTFILLLLFRDQRLIVQKGRPLLFLENTNSERA